MVENPSTSKAPSPFFLRRLASFSLFQVLPPQAAGPGELQRRRWFFYKSALYDGLDSQEYLPQPKPEPQN